MISLDCRCERGYFAVTPCTAHAPRAKCRQCPPGKYSDRHGLQRACIPCSRQCSRVGEMVVSNCTLTRDIECKCGQGMYLNHPSDNYCSKFPPNDPTYYGTKDKNPQSKSSMLKDDSVSVEDKSSQNTEKPTVRPKGDTQIAKRSKTQLKQRPTFNMEIRSFRMKNWRFPFVGCPWRPRAWTRRRVRFRCCFTFTPIGFKLECTSRCKCKSGKYRSRCCFRRSNRKSKKNRRRRSKMLLGRAALT